MHAYESPISSICQTPTRPLSEIGNFKKPVTPQISDNSSSTSRNRGGKVSSQIQKYLRLALKENFFVENGSSMSRSQITDRLDKWLTMTYTHVPFDVMEVLSSRSPGYAITAAFECQVTYGHGKWHNIAPKMLDTISEPKKRLNFGTPLKNPINTVTPSVTPLPSPLASPLKETPVARTKQKIHQRSAKLIGENSVIQDEQLQTPDSFSDSLVCEINQFQKLCQKDISAMTIDYSDLDSVISAVTFQDLSDSVRKHCPNLTEILKILVSSDEERKLKTESEKLLRAIHAQACLVKLSNQKGSSFPMFLGLLLVSYGSGEGELLITLLFHYDDKPHFDSY